MRIADVALGAAARAVRDGFPVRPCPPGAQRTRRPECPRVRWGSEQGSLRLRVVQLQPRAAGRRKRALPPPPPPLERAPQLFALAGRGSLVRGRSRWAARYPLQPGPASPPPREWGVGENRGVALHRPELPLVRHPAGGPRRGLRGEPVVEASSYTARQAAPGGEKRRGRRRVRRPQGC